MAGPNMQWEDYLPCNATLRLDPPHLQPPTPTGIFSLFSMFTFKLEIASTHMKTQLRYSNCSWLASQKMRVIVS